ncbi:MAG: hypothetical protein NC434_12740 [Ruminococcus sp.]|nr:hypothetical protein [Ruminococcus sp.]
MRVWSAELKKILKSRRTWILAAVSLFLTCIMAYLPVLYEGANYYEEAGNEVVLQGPDAIRYKKELRKELAGTVTTQKIRLAVEIYRECLQEYGVTNSYELPDEVFFNRLFAYEPLIHGVQEAYADRETGIAPSVTQIEPESLDSYYETCRERLDSLMKMEQKDSPRAQQAALDLYEKVEKPYVYYPGLGSNPIEYEGFLALLLLLFAVIIAAPVFSSDYQTGADDIQRCTKHGQFRLGAARIVTTLAVTGGLFLICMTLYLLISNSFFGWESTRTSMQMIFSVTALADWNLGELECVIAAAGLLSVMATICFVLLLSSKCRSVLVSSSIGLLMCMAPTLVYMVVPAGSSMSIWMRCFLPSNGVGLPTGYFYAANDYEFLRFGTLAVWMPYAMVGFAVAESIIFLCLTLRFYVRRKY